MAEKRWEFELEGVRHTVELEHNIFSNKQSVRVDGRLLPADAIPQTKGGRHAFRVDGHPCEVVIAPRGRKFDYDFLVGGVSSVPEKYMAEMAEAQSSEHVNSYRWAAVILFLAIGIGGNLINWYLAHAQGYYIELLAFLAPALALLAVYFIFSPKDFVAQYAGKFSLRTWVVIILALLLGLANNYAFSHGLY